MKRSTRPAMRSGWFLEHADPLLKVTIVPRGSGALGFAQYLPKEVALRNRRRSSMLSAWLWVAGPRSNSTFGRVTNGASDG